MVAVVYIVLVILIIMWNAGADRKRIIKKEVMEKCDWYEK